MVNRTGKVGHTQGGQHVRAMCLGPAPALTRPTNQLYRYNLKKAVQPCGTVGKYLTGLLNPNQDGVVWTDAGLHEVKRHLQTQCSALEVLEKVCQGIILH